MYKNLAWNHFIKTGNLETYIEYKKIEALDNTIDKKKGEIIDETYQGERNSNKRSSL
ncbi:MAG: hypothetical protein ACI4ON_04485 [Clostridia bacterium]